MSAPEEKGLRMTPHNLAAEALVIGSCLYNGRVISDCHVIEPEHFYSSIYGAVWAAMLAATRSQLPLTPEVLCEIGADVQRDTLIELLDHAGFGPEVRDNVRVVLDMHKRRQLIAAASELAGAATGGAGYVEPMEVIVDHLARVDAIRDAAGGALEVLSADAGAEAVIDGANQSALIKTGFETLDRRLVGIERGAVSFLGARPGVGKTAVALAMAANMANAESVGFFSLDVSGPVLRQRLALCLAGDSGRNHVPFIGQVRDRLISDVQRNDLIAALKSDRGRRIFIDDRGGLSVAQLDAQIRAWKSEIKRSARPALGAVFVDHIAKIYPRQRSASLYEKTSYASNELLELAKRHPDVAFIGLVQLSRGNDKENRRPRMSDMRDSGKLEEDGSAVLLLHREEMRHEAAMNNDALSEDERNYARSQYANCKGRLEVLVEKNRNGEITTVTLRHSIGQNMVRDNLRAVGEEF